MYPGGQELDEPGSVSGGSPGGSPGGFPTAFESRYRTPPAATTPPTPSAILLALTMPSPSLLQAAGSRIRHLLDRAPAPGCKLRCRRVAARGHCTIVRQPCTSSCTPVEPEKSAFQFRHPSCRAATLRNHQERIEHR